MIRTSHFALATSFVCVHLFAQCRAHPLSPWALKIQRILPIAERGAERGVRSTDPLITSITVQGAVALPISAVKRALQCCNIVGSTFNSTRAVALSEELNQWYQNNGFPMAQVSKPIQHPSADGQLVVRVQEPLVSASPVTLHYFQRKNKNQTIEFEAVTRTHTRASTVAHALGLRPGAPFKWSARDIDRLQSSKLFKDMALRNTSIAKDGGICVHLDVVEQDSYIFFEPGIRTNLGDRTLYGELNFRHENLFGMNQKLGVNAKYKPTSHCPEGCVDYENDRFGRCGGLSFKLFQSPGPCRKERLHQDRASGEAGVSERKGKQFLPTIRRGLKGKLRLTGASWRSTSVGAKLESIGLASSFSAAAPAVLPMEIIRAVSVESNAKTASSSGATHKIAASFVGGVSSTNYNRHFLTGLLTSRNVFPVEGENGGAGSSFHINALSVAQSCFLPAHERHHLRVRGADDGHNDAFKSTPAWLGGSLEFHTPLPGGVTGLLFLDGAQASGPTLDGQVAAVGSCGAGVFVGPLKIELVRHRAKNRVLVGLR